jgi:hypothetical protein
MSVFITDTKAAGNNGLKSDSDIVKYEADRQTDKLTVMKVGTVSRASPTVKGH